MRLLVSTPEQGTYELIRPIVLFGQSASARAVVTLYLDGWSVKAIAAYLETSRPTVYDVLRRG